MTEGIDARLDVPAGLGTNPNGEFARPLVSGVPVEVSEDVYVIADGRVSLVPNIGIVVGKRSALVIDTGLGPRNGSAVLRHAQHLAPGRSLYLAVTQMDPGHAFGARAFRGHAQIIYSVAQRQRLREHAKAYATAFQQLSPVVSDELAGLTLVDSDICYQEQLELDLGGVHAVLRQWGPAHTPDDQTVQIDDRVLFSGDLLETRMFPILPYFHPFDTGFDGDRWVAALDGLIQLDPRVVVPGHGEVTDKDQMVAVRDYLAYIRGTSHTLWSAGTPFDDAVARIERHATATWSDWESPKFIGLTVRAFYDQFESRPHTGVR